MIKDGFDPTNFDRKGLSSTCLFVSSGYCSSGNRFETLNQFASGCKTNISKSKVISLGSKRGTVVEPFNSLVWCGNHSNLKPLVSISFENLNCSLV